MKIAVVIGFEKEDDQGSKCHTLLLGAPGRKLSQRHTLWGAWSMRFDLTWHACTEALSNSIALHSTAKRAEADTLTT